MKQYLLLILILPFITSSLKAQAIIKGRVVDSIGKKAIPNAKISIEGDTNKITTDKEGHFEHSKVTFGSKRFFFEAQGYETLSKSFDVNKEEIDLGEILLPPQSTAEHESTLWLTDNDLDEDESISSTATLLQSSRDPYSQAAAFDWGPMWFRNRGYGSDQSRTLFNGIPLDQPLNDRNNFNSWGGLNDITRRAEEIVMGPQASDYSFGRTGENVYYSTQASTFPKGLRLNTLISTGSFTQRQMATYGSGLLPSGWAFVVSGSRRWAQEGFIRGNFYDAWAYFLAAEKKINDRHSLNLTAFGAPWRRGMNAALTKEMADIKGINYNPNWGWQDGRKRHAQIKRGFEPIFMLTHYWNLSEKIKLNSTLSYQFGQTGSSRLERGFGGKRASGDFIPVPDPMPTHYKKLPSGAQTLKQANKLREKFLTDETYSQINWPELYRQNLENLHTIDNYNGTNRSISGNAAKYYLGEDRSLTRILGFNTHLFWQLSDHISLKAALTYRSISLEQFKTVKDLLGAYFVYDVDSFAARGQSGDVNLRIPNRIAFKGDRIQYDYNLFKRSLDAYALIDGSYNRFDFYLGVQAAFTRFWREGKFQHYAFPEHSYGKSPEQRFVNFGLKGGLTLKFDGRNSLLVNGFYFTRPPELESAFPNARVNHLSTPGLKSPQTFGGTLTYLYNSPSIEARGTLYYTRFNNETLIRRYYLEGYESSFINEVTPGTGKRHLGVEMGVKIKLSSTWRLLAAASIGEFTYTNRPKLYYSHSRASDFVEKGKAYIKNYKVAGTPQQAYHLGIQYESPHYWRIGLSGNYMAAQYLDIMPGLRSEIFYEEASNPTEEQARKLLKQERFSDKFFLNLNAGKSWKLGEKFLTASLRIINLLNNTNYKTGGYEQGRKSTYDGLLEDQSRPVPRFDPRYWYAQGLLLSLSLSLRF